MKGLFLALCLASLVIPLSGCIDDGQSFSGSTQRSFQAASLPQARRLAAAATYQVQAQIQNQVRNQIQRCLPSGAAPILNIGLGMVRQAGFGGLGLRAAKNRANYQNKTYTAEYTGTLSCLCPLAKRKLRSRVVTRSSSQSKRVVTARGDVFEYKLDAAGCSGPSSSTSSQQSSSYSSAGVQY